MNSQPPQQQASSAPDAGARAEAAAQEIWQVVHIHPDAPPKPAYGGTCNGCGLCCLSEPCPVGIVISRRRHGACDALRWSDGESRYICGMVTDPAEVLEPRWRWVTSLLRRLSRRWISAGTGCDARLEKI